MRILRLFVGLGLTVVGSVVAAAGVLALYQHAAMLAFGALALGIAAVVGVASLIVWPYRVEWTPDGFLTLWFLFRSERITVDNVVWYRKSGVTWTLTSTNDRANADVFVIFRYRRPGYHRPSTAFFSLAGTGPGFSRNSAEYETLLDKHMPEKRRRPVPDRGARQR
jgi:hypothetical protein